MKHKKVSRSKTVAMRNPVAKFASLFNKAVVLPDSGKKGALKRGIQKHKGVDWD